MTGKIHSFQSLGTLDGPGVRFVVFLHGCNLRCGYCHNIDVCKGDYAEMSAEEVFEKILHCKDYFGENGGVTVSGGEPLLQAEFTAELFKLCRREHIHTALDTSGSIWNVGVEKVLSVTDLVLLDIKMTDNESYLNHIGCEMEKPLSFLCELEKREIPYWVRQVIVGGLNDTEENIGRLNSLLDNKKYLKKTELLPFKKMCSQKYENMGIDFPFAAFDEPSEENMTNLKALLKAGV